MWEEYELTYYSAKEQRDETLVDLADIKKQIQNLKTEIHVCFRQSDVPVTPALARPMM